MGDVIILDMETRLDIPAERVLQAAIDSQLKNVVLIGIDENDAYYFASSLANKETILWLVEAFKKELLN